MSNNLQKTLFNPMTTNLLIPFQNGAKFEKTLKLSLSNWASIRQLVFKTDFNAKFEKLKNSKILTSMLIDA